MDSDFKHKLDSLPENLQNEVFEKVGELAKTDKMNKNEVIAYLKSLYDMNIVQNEIRSRDNTIAHQRGTIAAQGNTIAALQSNNTALQNENAELRRRLGIN